MTITRIAKGVLSGLSILATSVIGEGANEATLQAYCLSVNLSKATASIPGISIEVFFTTYDGSDGIPLHDEIGSLWVFGGEIAPTPGLPGQYRTDYLVLGNDEFDSSGNAAITFPTGDSNANGVADFLETDLNGSVSFTGTITREMPSVSFDSFTGQITRGPGVRNGSYSIIVHEDGFGPVTYTGRTFVFNAEGSLTYDRRLDTAVLTITATHEDGTTTDYTADMSFDVFDENTVTFPAATLIGGPQIVEMFPFTLTRSGNRYFGDVEFYDAGLSTTWRDYVQFRLEVQDRNDRDFDGIPDLSDAYISPPVIVEQPQNITAAAGDTVQFGVTASGSYPLSYQWQRNGQDLVGATQHFYTISNVGLRNAGEFRVVISNPAGEVISETATLTVLAPPSIVAGPGSMTALLGQPVEFTVTAGGTSPLSFQWQHNGAAIDGATDATFSITAVELADHGEYTVVISNTAGIIESSPVLLTVVIPELQLSVESLPNGSFRMEIRDNGGMPITPERQAKLEILATTDLSRALANWASYSLADYPLEDGAILFEDPDGSVFPDRFYILSENP